MALHSLPLSFEFFLAEGNFYSNNVIVDTQCDFFFTQNLRDSTQRRLACHIIANLLRALSMPKSFFTECKMTVASLA